MTKQNVLVSDTKSTFNMAISNSTIFTRAAQEPPAAPAEYISISRKKLLKNLEINGEARINTWVDSMKASSPTHIKATPSLADHDQSSWIVSILVNKLKKKKKTKLFKERRIFFFWWLWDSQ
jgi:trehalose 6-phosphate phosphatase